MTSNEHSNSSSRRRHFFATAAGSIALAGVVGATCWLSRWTQSKTENSLPSSPLVADLARSVPPIPPSAGRLLPPLPDWDVEEATEPRFEIVIDVDRNGNVRMDGQPMPVDALRDLLALRQVEAGSVGVTIRADERCRFYHVRQVIRACDESAGVPYKLLALPESGNSQSS